MTGSVDWGMTIVSTRSMRHYTSVDLAPFVVRRSYGSSVGYLNYADYVAPNRCHTDPHVVFGPVTSALGSCSSRNSGLASMGRGLRVGTVIMIVAAAVALVETVDREYAAAAKPRSSSDRCYSCASGSGPSPEPFGVDTAMPSRTCYYRPDSIAAMLTESQLTLASAALRTVVAVPVEMTKACVAPIQH